MTYRRGDIILVPHEPPASGPGREGKRRPLVVVSSDAYHAERRRDVLAALITTRGDKYHGRTDYALQDWQAAGMRAPSTVRCTLMTVEHEQILGRPGCLTNRDLAGVHAALGRALGLQD